MDYQRNNPQRLAGKLSDKGYRSLWENGSRFHWYLIQTIYNVGESHLPWSPLRDMGSCRNALENLECFTNIRHHDNS